jgi:ABC-type phosphate/phosphonate transport system permease subunit
MNVVFDLYLALADQAVSLLGKLFGGALEGAAKDAVEGLSDLVAGRLSQAGNGAG